MSDARDRANEIDRSAADRRRRLVILVAADALIVGAGLLVGAIGDRRVAAEIARIRSAAQAARVDPAAVALGALGAAPDPIAAALGTDAVRAGYERPDHTWCFSLVVERLLASRSVHFEVALDGSFAETSSCTER